MPSPAPPAGIDGDQWERGKALPPMPGMPYGGRGMGPPPGMRGPPGGYMPSAGPLPALHRTASAYKVRPAGRQQAGGVPQLSALPRLAPDFSSAVGYCAEGASPARGAQLCPGPHQTSVSQWGVFKPAESRGARHL